MKTGKVIIEERRKPVVPEKGVMRPREAEPKPEPPDTRPSIFAGH